MTNTTREWLEAMIKHWDEMAARYSAICEKEKLSPEGVGAHKTLRNNARIAAAHLSAILAEMPEGTPPTLAELRESGELFLCEIHERKAGSGEALIFLVRFDGDILGSDDHGFIIPLADVTQFKRLCDPTWTEVRHD